MRAAVALLLVSSVALADPPADAPLDLPGRSVRLEPGQPAPFGGRLLSDAEHVASEKVAASDAAFRKATAGNVMLSPYAVVAIVAGALAVGAAAGVAVAVAVRR